MSFARALMEIAPANAFKQWPILLSYRLVGETGVQEDWINGEITNFEYLMALNTISGRSYNDLCQVNALRPFQELRNTNWLSSV
jgi:hypothetical protein